MNNNNYGFIFNDINIIDDKFIKKFKNSLGKKKINNEIKFYKQIIDNNISFNIPKLITYNDGIIVLEFIKNSTTLTNIINETNIIDYYKIISAELEKIHNNKIIISQEKVYIDLKIEIIEKILNRFNEYDWYNNETFKQIDSVNNIKIKDIEYYSNKIFKKLIYYLQDRKFYNLIHGDIHLGNILVDGNQVYFIDPRGYFGNTELYGLFEYDYAKLLFGLSGYSLFDNLYINELTIKGNNIEIDLIKKYEFIFESDLFDNITKLLSLSIWLGNNSCFIDINKKITSLMIAYYYCEKYIDKY